MPANVLLTTPQIDQDSDGNIHVVAADNTRMAILHVDDSPRVLITDGASCVVAVPMATALQLGLVLVTFAAGGYVEADKAIAALADQKASLHRQLRTWQDMEAKTRVERGELQKIVNRMKAEQDAPAGKDTRS